MRRSSSGTEPFALVTLLTGQGNHPRQRLTARIVRKIDLEARW
jgi:hypothetical protein